MSNDADPAWTMNICDLHLPVLAVRRQEDRTADLPKPVVYGTAFPIALGVFVTAGHVVNHATQDGDLALSTVERGAGIRPYVVDVAEVFNPIDLGILRCDALRHLPVMQTDFDRVLGMLATVSAVGFPLALDPEYVVVVPRAFGGHVVARRKMYQFSGQPVGYEVTFAAPQGLSGAPLVSTEHGVPRCYGYMVQQATLGVGAEVTPIGIGVSIEEILTVVFDGSPVARLFGREPVHRERPTPPPLSGGFAIDPTIAEGWPDDDLPESRGTDDPECQRRPKI